MITRLIFAARILASWIAGLAVVFLVAFAGLGSLETATWALTIFAAFSAPFILLGVIIRLTLPQLLGGRIAIWVIYCLLVALGLGLLFIGWDGAVLAAYVTLPCVLIYVAVVELLPLRAEAKQG
jgi:hypothetical protein